MFRHTAGIYTHHQHVFLTPPPLTSHQLTFTLTLSSLTAAEASCSEKGTPAQTNSNGWRSYLHSTFLLFGPPRMSIISGRVDLTGPAVLLAELSGVISAIESIAG